MTVGFTAGIAVIILSSQLKDCSARRLRKEPGRIHAEARTRSWRASTVHPPVAIARRRR